jgi:hypothetical protein
MREEYIHFNASGKNYHTDFFLQGLDYQTKYSMAGGEYSSYSFKKITQTDRCF